MKSGYLFDVEREKGQFMDLIYIDVESVMG